jgi:transcriptional regulator with XRE-family HTH domain
VQRVQHSGQPREVITADRCRIGLGSGRWSATELGWGDDQQQWVQVSTGHALGQGGEIPCDDAVVAHCGIASLVSRGHCAPRCPDCTVTAVAIHRLVDPTKKFHRSPNRATLRTVPGITVSRIRLSNELVKWRTAAKVSRKAAADVAGCSLSHLGHIETGRNAPTTEDQLVQLARLYKIPADTLDYLKGLWADASEPGWWSRYGLSADYARYVGLETDAEQVLNWETTNIPGLLQTERYMRHKFSLDIPRLSAREIDKRVLTRLNRQHRISGSDDPLRLVVVVDEIAVRRAIHTPLVAAGQLHQLIQRASLPNVELHVLPLEAGVHAGQDGAFSILMFPHACPAAPEPLIEPVIYQEFPTGGDWTTVPSDVERMHTRLDALRSQALGCNESLAWLTQRVEEHTR